MYELDIYVRIGPIYHLGEVLYSFEFCFELITIHEMKNMIFVFATTTTKLLHVGLVRKRTNKLKTKLK